MDEEKTREEVQGEAILLTPYMSFVIGCLQRDGKHPSVHTYTATLHSFTAFATSKGVPMQIPDVFTVARLKQYQAWLRQRKASWNTVSTYMRTLRAVYNRLVAAQLVIRDPHLFDEVYTKVESQTKRALTDEQTRTLAAVDPTCLPEDVQRALSYFLLMFLFRGMPFIDLAHLRRQDVKLSTSGEEKVLIHQVIQQGSKAASNKISGVRWPEDCLVVSVKRGREELIPKGSTLLLPGDTIFVLADTQRAGHVREQLREVCSDPL